MELKSVLPNTNPNIGQIITLLKLDASLDNALLSKRD